MRLNQISSDAINELRIPPRSCRAREKVGLEAICKRKRKHLQSTDGTEKRGNTYYYTVSDWKVVADPRRT